MVIQDYCMQSADCIIVCVTMGGAWAALQQVKQIDLLIQIVYSNFEPLFNSQSVGNTILMKIKNVHCELWLKVALFSAPISRSCR